MSNSPSTPEQSALWRNMLFHGDNLAVMDALLRPAPVAGVDSLQQTASIKFPAPLPPLHPGIRLIYIDPPFAVGANFHARLSPKNMLHYGVMPPTPRQGTTSDASAHTSVFAYSDIWEGGMEGYMAMLRPRIERMRGLLTSDGCLCVHCDWRAVHHIRLLLDACFGPENFVNEIIWHYTGGGRAHRHFSRKHDSLLLYANGPVWPFNADAVRVPYKATSSYAKSGIVSKSGKRYLPNPKGTPLDDVWDIPIINPMAAERTGYATQKPEKLIERLILALSAPDDLIADFFCGSGTTLAVAQKLGRRWIGCDAGELAFRTTRHRLGNEGYDVFDFEP